ncbi:MAG: carbohydrate kinase family protein [Thaumarchaeota archaeon]|nr:carbohydrate kinase family protein [Nitrososphaerota archaeon]
MSQILELQERLSKLSVSVLPDFFADRILYVPSLQKLFEDAKMKASYGGGSLRGYKQKEIKGGNATNLAFALSSLSVKTNLFIVGDDIAKGFTASKPKHCNVHVIDGASGYTIAIEFPYKGKDVNVMVSDVGDVAEFSGDKLSTADIKTISESSCTALVNWSSNKRGNQLAELIFSLPKRENRLNFLDPADLTGTEDRIDALIKRIVKRGLLDVLSMNENEARILSARLSSKLPSNYGVGDVKRVARSLHDVMDIAVDIHTPQGCVSAIEEETFWAESFGNIEGIVTGAGDIWDSGDIVGYLLRLETQRRLQLANACAYLYLSSKNAKSPSLDLVVKFLEKRKISLF